MAVRIICPVPMCGAVCSATDAALGKSVKCPKCGRPFVASPTLDGRQTQDTKKSRPTAGGEAFPVLPAAFGRYRVLELLGRGGMGAVYLAEDSQLGRKVALKIPFIAGSDAVRVERFAREARSAAVLHHPNICTVFDAGTIDGRPFITMAHVAGRPLDRVIDPDAPMPVRRAAEIVRGIARALAYAHEHGVTHRDLKPANVMLTPAGEPVVMDFGLAKLAGDADPSEAKLTRQGGLVGTPSYMAPEQVRGDTAAVGPATDVYALGAVLFELLTGHPPYTGPLTAVLGQILGAPVPPLTAYRKDAPVWLGAICEQALAKEPSARFAGMAEFARALDAFLEPTGSTRVPAAPPTPPREVTVEVELVRAPARSKPGTPKAPHKVEAPPPDSPFEQMTTPAAKPEPTRLPARPLWQRPTLIAAALLLPLVVWAAAVVLRVETPNGTLVVELDDPTVEARIKNGKLILSGPDGKDRYTLSAAERDKTIDAGAYKVRVEGADGLSLDTPEFTMKKGDRVTLRVKIEPKAVAKKETPAPAEKRDTGAAAIDPDRRAAEYVFSQGGSVRVNGDPREIKQNSELPSGPFRLTWIVVDNPKVNDAGLEVFGNCTNLACLHLRSPNVGDAGLVHFRECKQLIALQLFHTAVTDKTLAQFADRKLVSLSLYDCRRVTNAGLLQLKNCTELVELELTSTYITDPGLTTFKDCNKIATLRLSATGITDAGLANFRGCPLVGIDFSRSGKMTGTGLANLRLDNLEWAFLSETGFADQGLLQLKNCHRLSELTLQATKVTEVGIEALRAALPNCRAYWDGSPDRRAAAYVLNLGGIIRVNQEPEDLRALAALPTTPFLRLTSFTLEGNRQVTDDGLTAFKGCKHLTSLNLQSTPVTDRGLSNFKDCDKLESINLRGTVVRSAGLENFQNCKGLTYINLHDCYNVGDTGLAYLRSGNKIQRLALGRTQVTDAGLMTLKDCTDMISIDVFDTKITAEGAARFQKLLPKCKMGLVP